YAVGRDDLGAPVQELPNAYKLVCLYRLTLMRNRNIRKRCQCSKHLSRRTLQTVGTYCRCAAQEN
ncbi:MAG: hypothetical protein ACI3V2_08855, partial [Faecousia sp.]